MDYQFEPTQDRDCTRCHTTCSWGDEGPPEDPDDRICYGCAWKELKTLRRFHEPCACGGKFGSKVIRQHRRRCLSQLLAWSIAGKDIRLLDDRPEVQKAALPVGRVGERGPGRCNPRHGRCGENAGHPGMHNAWHGPWAGSEDGIELDDD